MLGHRRRRWLSIKTTLGRCLVFGCRLQDLDDAVFRTVSVSDQFWEDCNEFQLEINLCVVKKFPLDV